MDDTTTRDLLREFTSAEQCVQHAKEMLNQEECRLKDATNELGKRLLPKNAEEGKEYGIWVNGEGIGLRDVLYLATKTNQNDGSYSVRWWVEK